MKRMFSLVALAVLLCCACGGHSEPADLGGDIRIQKIYANPATHSAFPSIVKFKGRYFVLFREGVSHIFDENGNAEGHVRIISSPDGKRWESVADFGLPGFDLRDPKLSVTPDGRLMATVGGSIYREKKLVGRIPQVCFSTDGKTFTDPQPIEVDPPVECPLGEWLWRVTWHEGVGYGVSYFMGELRLLSTTDGVHYKEVSRPVPPDVAGKCTETTLRFLPDGRMILVVRRDPNPVPALMAVAAPPYTDWEWKTMTAYLGGPDVLVRPDASLIVGGRYWFEAGKQCKTLLWKADTEGHMNAIVILPSAGDNSYPGFLVEGDELWVCYYSSVEKLRKPGIFLARMPLSLFENTLKPVNCDWGD